MRKIDRRSERQKRRDELLSWCRAKVPLAKAAAKVGVCYGTALEYCRAAGIKPIRKPYKLDLAKYAEWEKLDWKMRNVELAVILGVSRERVRQIRKKLGE